MHRMIAVAVVWAGLVIFPVAPGSASAAWAQEAAACRPLFDAARKALTQPGIERTAVLGDPTKPSMTMTARKTDGGWYMRRGTGAWQAMPIDPEAQERVMLDDGSAFSQCVAGATETVAGEPARAWTYTTAGMPSTIWIGVARGLPLKVQAQGALQTSVYQATPFPKP